MNSTVFLATLGQRPEAITVAFDLLRNQYNYRVLGVLHTDGVASGIAEPLKALKQVLAADYPTLNTQFHELRRANGSPIQDLSDSVSAQAYHRAVLTILHEYRQQGSRVHLLVSGGRKAMSIYAMLAAAALFDPPHDKVWTVLSPEAMITREGVFHIPPGMRREVQIVDLPLITARLAPGINPVTLIERSASRSEQFLDKLSQEERNLALTLKGNPYARNTELAQSLGKSPRTVENQFASIYGKLIGFLDCGETIDPRKRRQALLDVLAL